MEFIIGIAVGILLGAILFHRRPVGDLRVDRSDSTENPSLFLELERDVWFVSRKKKNHSPGPEPRLPPARIARPIMEPTNF